MTTQISHIPSLDGIRALSIMIVFFAHAGYELIPGGFGVTVFFFLSGFLITTLMRQEQETTGNINLKLFYYRRFLRLAPPLVIALVLMITLTKLHLLPGQVYATPLIFQITYLANYYNVYLQSYFNAPILEVSGILWSLAVEEHFYLFYPCLYFYLSKFFSRKTQVLTLISICLMVLIWRVYLVIWLHAPIEHTYYLSDTRIDSILYGCILALLLNPVMDKKIYYTRRFEYFLIVLSLGFLLFTFIYRDPIFRETVRYSLQGIALIPIFYFAIDDYRNPLFSWLSTKVMSFLGQLSYTMYLVHFAVIKSVQHVIPTVSLFQTTVLSFSLTFLLALSIYWWIEKPIANLRRALHKRSLEVAKVSLDIEKNHKRQ